MRGVSCYESLAVPRFPVPKSAASLEKPIFLPAAPGLMARAKSASCLSRVRFLDADVLKASGNVAYMHMERSAHQRARAIHTARTMYSAASF